MIDAFTQQYLNALDIDGLRKRDLTLVAALQTAHLARFSFNNIDVLLGEELKLDLEALQEKIMSRNRGGYCFEHNKLLFHALESLGFDVKLVLGKVTKQLESDGPRTHRITLLKYQEREFLVDVGFGPYSPSQPIPFVMDEEIELGSITYRIVKNDRSEFVLQKRANESFSSLYTFDSGFYTEGDCEAGNLYSHRHENAAFLGKFLVSLVSPAEVKFIFNQVFRVIGSDGGVTEMKIKGPGQLKEILAEVFSVRVDDAEAELLFAKSASFEEIQQERSQ
mmetsp:Transcript_14175/g.23478  ORF Transcript_14175/g.23478 Transcript_14175/m.23478 type:complete len:279 (-) Transcript_14175:120-956(-)|eukprot:CAMPEP_0119015224 /NCGR_PEP_ID=MMETSP1176-20130426/10647_1 /TAXON_ID=265551 /ORGANISM="Synedropsis recta cf, Strain CCMP1620" /LENGTH=278 /DNA_ID=CAMNT_0006968501 /DNA_START=50 /DNA_END=886 /DNA_ORIENTATION=-